MLVQHISLSFSLDRFAFVACTKTVIELGYRLRDYLKPSSLEFRVRSFALSC